MISCFCGLVVWLIVKPQANITNNKTTKQQNMICLEDNTERSESNPGRSLGITNNEGRAVWKTVPPTERSIR